MNKTVLIVEDEFIVAEDIRFMLQNAGYDVSGIADSVVEAKELIKNKKPALVLLDIYLKGDGTGIELASELKEQNIAFVYLSANSNQKILEAAKATEPYGFLVKPFKEQDLLVMLDIAFYKHQNSAESIWRKEMALQKELRDILQSEVSLQLKLERLAVALQAHIPFDLISFACAKSDPKCNKWFSLLRIGFDEYQFVGLKELAIISGVKQSEFETSFSILSSTETDLQYFNSGIFLSKGNTLAVHSLLAKVFEISSCMRMPLTTNNNDLLQVSFYSRNDNTYGTEKINAITRLQLPVASFLETVLLNEKISEQPQRTSKKKQPDEDAFAEIVGSSHALMNVLDLITQVAPVDTSVLLLGESGTGKEKIASAIHQLSPRKNMPFIKINCAAFPSTLIESELFGHEKGAFTNAISKRIGKFEQAESGTIFLDEIGEMPVELQVKLLRVLQEKEIERIGGKQPIKIDVRIIAATNKNLQAEIAQGKFRLDLYYRLNVFPILLPPLRDRKEDIKILAEHFAETFAKKIGKSFYSIGDAMLQQLYAYPFPGNIRELENVIEQAVILNDGHSPLALREPLVPDLPVENFSPLKAIKTIEDIKRLQRLTEIEHISAVLTRTHGRIRGKDGAAELLDEKPTTLESRLLKLGIKKEDFH